MALSAGTRLGHYDVTTLLGEGGMGQVWQATDTTLNRQVALKILPDAFSADPDRLARFKREAHILASLNHPNIAAIYGIEEAEGTRALVLELVEGPTLADRISKGPIPLDEALPIAKQMAEALEAAHEAGVIHRDLKPANIKVREDGTVKVLDFGLAKALDPNPEGDPSLSPTLTAAATQQGVILGTAAYMSPEQARGKPVDKRADIWAFGCVFFEILSGRKVFAGEDVSVTLADVIRAEPAWDRLPGDVPLLLLTFLKRCLRKDPRERVRDIGDVRLAAEGAFDVAALSSPEAEQSSDSGLPWLLALAALLLGAVAAAATTWGLLGSPSSAPDTSYLQVGVAPADQLGSTGGGQLPGNWALSRTAFAVSPDGRRIVFAGRSGGAERLYLWSLVAPEAQPIGGTAGAMNPFFSPDGESVGFWASGQLMKVALAGGPPVPLASLSERMYGASWGEAGTIVFASRLSGLLSVPATGGTPTVVTALDDEPPGTAYYLPSVLPGGDAVLFTRLDPGRPWDRAQVVVYSPATDERKVLIQGANPLYVPSGHLLFVRLGVLWAAPFDLDALEVTGPEVPMVENVTQAAQLSGFPVDSGATQVGVSQTGTLVYLSGGLLARDERALVWFDRQGVRKPLGLSDGEYWSPRVSPDGRRVAVDSMDDARGMVIFDRRRGVAQRLSDNAANVGAWMPDGSRVLFRRARNLFWQATDGTEAERLTTSPNAQFAGAVTKDGRELLFVESRPGAARAQSDILMLRLDPLDETAVPLFDSPANEMYPALSPDGRWLAYAHDRSGQFEVHVVRYPELDEGVQVSTAGGYMPTWSPAGDELFYLRRGASSAAQDLMMAVEVSTADRLEPEAPRELFRGYFEHGLQVRSYDVAPDGRFLMVERDTGSLAAPATSLHFVQNWFEELNARVPVN